MGAPLRGAFAFWLVSTLAMPAMAVLNATVELDAPGGDFEGAALTHVTFHMDDANGPVVGEWMGFMFTAGGILHGVFSVSDDPGVLDAMRVEYRSPLTGAVTTIVVDPLVLPIEFYLPNPSDGVEIAIPPTTPGNPVDNAIVRVSVGSTGGGADQTAPTCEITRSGTAIDALLHDAESGLGEIEIEWASNVSVSVPTFDPGTVDVVLNGTVIDPEKTTTLTLDVYDVAGNRTLCKSVTKISGGGGEGPPSGEGGGPLVHGVPSLAPGALGALTVFVVATAALYLRRRD